MSAPFLHSSMGLVSFSTRACERRPGYHLDGQVVDLTSISGAIDVSDDLPVLDVLAGRLASVLEFEADSTVFAASEVSYHLPIDPPRLIRLEGCYEQDASDTGFNPHLEKYGLNDRHSPTLWMAPNHSLSGPGGSVLLPQRVSDVRAGAELAIVIAEDCKHLDQNSAFDVVAGALPVISLAAFDELPGIDGYKMYESFVTVGKEIEPLTREQISTLSLKLAINDDARDHRSTDGWRFSIDEQLAFASEVLTLRQGDILFTGIPTRVDRSLREGDQITTTIPTLGSVTTNVA